MTIKNATATLTATADSGSRGRQMVSAILQRLTGAPSDLPLELDDAPSDPRARKAHFERERETLLARLAKVEAELLAISGGEVRS